MLYELSKLVLRAFSAGYKPLKDMYKCMKNKKKFVKKLEDNLTKLICELATFYSRKEKIDCRLDATVSEEKNGEYDVLVKQMEFHHRQYDEFVNKYQHYCRDLPSFEIHDASSATKVMDALQERKPTIKIQQFFKLATLSKEIKELLDEISMVSCKMEPEKVLRDRKIESVQVKYDDVDLPLSNEYVKEILGFLSEDGNRSVGISGPIGVGKTTVMKELNNQLKDSSSLNRMTMSTKFDFVIWIECHKKREGEDNVVEGIQGEIMGRLKLKGEKVNSVEQNAEIISDFLCDRRYLLLIDQVSSTINLDEVGVHRDHKFGRVVLACSSKKVISPMTDQQVEIKPLSDNDALKLFLKVNGKINDTRIKLIAESIVQYCGGLPLVIKLVAYHLKGQKDEQVWSDVKRILESDPKANVLNMEGIGHAYKLAYDRLETSHKKCLLFVTLFTSDQKIYKDYLIECWNAERFLEVDVPELRAARERGASTLRELTDQYLLQILSDKRVKIPEYFRKVLAKQEYPGENDCLSWMPQNNQPLTEEIWRTTRRLSLIGCKSTLPSRPRSDNMSTLLMQSYHDLVELEDPFFDHMQKLLILDLYKAKIESLPTSISSLVSLRCLYLNDCRQLAKLPPTVQKLENLEVIDIRRTSVCSLPNEIGDMFQLKCLRFSFGQTGCNRKGKCKGAEMTIPLNIIRRLHQLEELTIEVGCCNEAWSSIADQIVIEVASLEKLSTLNFHFPNVTCFELFVAKSKSLKNKGTHWSTNTLRSFSISIGCCDTRQSYGSKISAISPERLLRFSTGGEISSVKELLRQANTFELVGHGGVGSLTDFNLINAGTLKVCMVDGCRNMTSIVDGFTINVMQMEITEESDCAILQCLEKLYLFDLKTLQTIWKGPVSSGSLGNLKELILFGCPELTTILNHEQATALASLEYIKVENCSEVVEIIHENIDADSTVDLSNMLNKVKIVDLVDLPKLRSICKTTTSMKWRSLVKIAIISCNGLRDIHLSLRNAEKLEIVECEQSWWIQLTEEPNKTILPCCHFVFLEQKPTNQACHQGESSEHGRPTHPLSSNGSVSSDCNGIVMSRDENNLLISNTNSGPQDMLEPSNGAEHVIHQSTNTIAPANKEASSSKDMLEPSLGVEHVIHQSPNTIAPASKEASFSKEANKEALQTQLLQQTK